MIVECLRHVVRCQPFVICLVALCHQLLIYLHFKSLIQRIKIELCFVILPLHWYFGHDYAGLVNRSGDVWLTESLNKNAEKSNQMKQNLKNWKPLFNYVICHSRFTQWDYIFIIHWVLGHWISSVLFDGIMRVTALGHHYNDTHVLCCKSLRQTFIIFSSRHNATIYSESKKKHSQFTHINK